MLICPLTVISGRKKDKLIPEELYDKWERDRVKKAKCKRLRELKRIVAVVDPFMTRKGGKGVLSHHQFSKHVKLATLVSLECI